MPQVANIGIPHTVFTDHYIRVHREGTSARVATTDPGGE